MVVQECLVPLHTRAHTPTESRVKCPRRQRSSRVLKTPTPHDSGRTDLLLSPSTSWGGNSSTPRVPQHTPTKPTIRSLVCSNAGPPPQKKTASKPSLFSKREGKGTTRLLIGIPFIPLSSLFLDGEQLPIQFLSASPLSCDTDIPLPPPPSPARIAGRDCGARAFEEMRHLHGRPKKPPPTPSPKNSTKDKPQPLPSLHRHPTHTIFHHSVRFLGLTIRLETNRSVVQLQQKKMSVTAAPRSPPPPTSFHPPAMHPQAPPRIQ